jgi:hypothetical protein
VATGDMLSGVKRRKSRRPVGGFRSPNLDLRSGARAAPGGDRRGLIHRIVSFGEPPIDVRQ